MITSAAEFVDLRSRNDKRADRDNAPEEVWLEVVRDYPEMKEWVIQNKTVPRNLLIMLADDIDSHVRFCVAMKRRCPAAVLEKLAQDPEDQVRLRVACNAKTPISVLRVLANDSSKDVAEAASEQLHTTA